MSSRLAMPRRLALALCLFGSAVAAGESRFDISYLWHSDLAAARAYRERLTSVLGSGIGERLLVVRGERSYGVIYDRNGDAVSTRDVADGHTRLLRSRGLEPAAPVLSRSWPSAGATAPPTAAPPSAPATTSARSTRTAGLPPQVSANVETSLGSAIETYVEKLRHQGRVESDERTSWAVYDLVGDRKLVSINADMPLQAASLIKPAIALAFFHRVAAGELQYGPRSRSRMEAMIRDSDNGATNWAMQLVGGPRGAQALLQRHYGEIFRDLDLVEYIPSGGRTYRNRDSVHDYLRLLYAVWHDQVPRASELRRLMGLKNRDRLSENLPSSVRIYDKTGSTRQVCGNLGIVEARVGGRRVAYAVVGVIEKGHPARSYGPWINARGDVIREVSGLVYRELSQGRSATSIASGAR